ncbi:14723_t:CDS:2, partial [Gigaspora rosea]
MRYLRFNPFKDGQEDTIEDHSISYGDYYKENGQPRLNTVLVSSIAMPDAFKNSSDSLT